MSSGIKSLILCARQHGVDLSAEKLNQKYSLNEEHDIDLKLLLRIANDNNLKAKKVNIQWDDFASMSKAWPLIAQLKNGKFAILVGTIEKDSEVFLNVLDPLSSKAKVETLSRDRVNELWDGTVILLKQNFKLFDENQPFSMSWLSMELFKRKVLLMQIFLISMVMHIFGFLPIIYIMTVLDKVVNYKATSTLLVIALGVSVAHIFNGIFGYMKKYISIFISSKIEAKLSMKAFNAVMDMPLGLFHKMDRSNIIKSVQQVDSIRQFLTMKLFGTVLDASSLLIFVPIMILYSPSLFLVVLVFAILIAANNVASAKKQREAIKRLSQTDGLKQSILMNSVSGIETVKSLTLESLQKNLWEESSSKSIHSNIELNKLSARSAQISSTLQQLMTVAVIFLGVILVFEGSLSAGVLIGANMLAGKITSPLVGLVTLTSDFRMFEMSVSALGNIVNSKKEITRAGTCPQIKGDIEFKNINFEYQENIPVLSNLSMKIGMRQKVGIIGSSGSGKTTLAQLVQGLLKAQSGTILIDGIDSRTIDMGHLRLNISYVAQDNTFFRETIRQNIIKSMPNAPMERVIWASKLASFHQEVEKMQDGYETMLEEGGANLSSGQRQKLALARALIRNPKILILDEALSNLGINDLISINENMNDIASGRTLIQITPIISQVTDCDMIFVLEDGKIVEWGNHQTLLNHNGLYANMWNKERKLYGLSA